MNNFEKSVNLIIVKDMDNHKVRHFLRHSVKLINLPTELPHRLI